MPRLKDVLDAVLADFYAARAASDLRAVELQKLYQTDETLSQLSIPLFKIGQLDLEIPVAMQDLEDDAPQVPKPTVSSDHLLAATTEIFVGLSKRDLDLTPTKKEIALLTRLADKDHQSYILGEIEGDAFATVLVSNMMAVLNDQKARISTRQTVKWPAEIAQILTEKFPVAKPAPQDGPSTTTRGATVAINPAALKSGDMAPYLTKLKLQITEDSFRIDSIPTNTPDVYKRVVVMD